MSMIKRHLENWIDELSLMSGYSYGFLMDRFMEMMDENEVDIEQFIAITMERDW